MKQLVVLLLFNSLFFFSNAQKKMQISVSSWVNEPNVECFEKPLIFVDFWATWCGPCISSMPHTENLINEFGNDVLFIYMSNEPSGKVEKFMKKRDKTFFSAVDSTESNIEAFKIKALPYSVLMDYEGNVIWKGKPNEMDKSLLKRFISLYKYEKGKSSRFINIKPDNKKIIWKHFSCNFGNITYLKTENIANEFLKRDSNEFYISGDIKYFISTIKNIPTSQISSKSKKNKKYMILCKTDSIKLFYNTLENFINKECKVKIVEKEEIKKIFVIKNNGNENFFNDEMYNFEKGNNSFLVDDQTIMIDNGTIKEMADKLSQFSGYIFLYEGDDNERYDWNIHHKYIKFTLEQLSSELNFTINEKEKKVKVYYLYDL